MVTECREVKQQVQGPERKEKPRGTPLGPPRLELWGQHREGHSYGALPDSPHRSTPGPGGLWMVERAGPGWRQGFLQRHRAKLE